VEAALIHAVEARFVAVEESELGGSGQGFEGGGEAADRVEGGFLLGHAVFDEALLDGPGAALAPVGGGHLFDHSELDAIDGSEALQVKADQGFEVLAVFLGENDAIGKEAVAHRIGRGAALSFRGVGAARAGAVGSGGEDSS
jgi:hypothetical protein